MNEMESYLPIAIAFIIVTTSPVTANIADATIALSRSRRPSGSNMTSHTNGILCDGSTYQNI